MDGLESFPVPELEVAKKTDRGGRGGVGLETIVLHGFLKGENNKEGNVKFVCQVCHIPTYPLPVHPTTTTPTQLSMLKCVDAESDLIG